MRLCSSGPAFEPEIRRISQLPWMWVRSAARNNSPLHLERARIERAIDEMVQRDILGGRWVSARATTGSRRAAFQGAGVAVL